METCTRLYDPNSNFITSSGGSRTVFTVPAGTLVNAKKIKVINCCFEKKNGDELYFGPRGVYELIKSVSITSLKGTQIDRMINRGSLNIMGLYNLQRFDNGGQYAMGRQLNENIGTSIFVQSPSQIKLTENAGQGQAEKMEITLDISAMLQYLQARTVIFEGFQLIIEWEDPVGTTLRLKNDKPPVLCLNEFLNPEVMKVEKNPVIEFNTLIQDRFYIGVGTTSLQTRLNAFFNMYISKLWYYNVYNDNTNGMAYQPTGEQFNLFINSKQVLVLKGWDTAAKKCAAMTDCMGQLTVPNGVYSKLQVPLGLLNPNYANVYNADDEYDGMFSYGALQLNKWVGNDITIQYNMDAKLFTCYLYIVAEVARTYNREADVVGYLSIAQAQSRGTSSHGHMHEMSHHSK
jgi:hypothetical protein